MADSSGLTSYAIVAIPSDADLVWSFSSEKVPHLTLLYLGNDLANIGEVSAFVKHAAQTTLNEFWLPVNRRALLGEYDADVLFFEEEYAYRLQNFRSFLLTNRDISTAYQSVEQYPAWIPHLTMGFPETPARDNQRERFTAVDFDRIALWTGDYEGDVFPLTDNAALHSRVSAGENFMAHYGVLGMKWGQRRANRPGGGKPESPDATRAKTLTLQGRNSGRDSLSNEQLQKLTQRWNLEQQYDRLRPKTNGEKVSEFIGGLLYDHGKQQAKAYVNTGVETLIKNAGKS